MGRDILGKMTKNCMKITKSIFWWVKLGGEGFMRDKPIFGVMAGLPSPPHCPIPLCPTPSPSFPCAEIKKELSTPQTP